MGPDGRGKSIANLVSMNPNEQIAALLAVRDWPSQNGQQFIVMGTQRGSVKKMDLTAFSNPRSGGIIAMGVQPGDTVIAAELTTGRDQVFLGTQAGMSIRFAEGDVRTMGRAAYGVRGINLRGDDKVVAMEIVESGGTILTVTEHGYGKRTELEEYRVQSRGGVGILDIRTSSRNGNVVGTACVHTEDELMIITQRGKVLRMVVSDVRPIGRATQGVCFIEMKAGDRVVSMARLRREEDVEPQEEDSSARALTD